MAEGNEQEKAMVEGIQAMIKAKKEGFAEYQESVQKSQESRTMMAMARSQSIRDTGSSQQDDEKKEKTTMSREAQSMM